MKAALLGLLLVFVPVALVRAADPPAHAEAGAASHDEHHAPGHAGANTSPDEVKGDLAIFSAIVFLLLVVILRKFAWGPIAAGLEKREGHIAHEIAAAEKANHDAKAMLVEYQTKLDAAQGEVKAMLDVARRDAEHTKQEFVALARQEASAEAARAKREIETAKDQAMRELAQVATDQALALAGKLLQQKLQPADHARLIDEAMANFPKSKANLN